MELEMSKKAKRFATHYDIFCRAANTMKTYTLVFNKETLNWDDAIPQMIDYFAPYAEAYKVAKGLSDNQIKDYVKKLLIKTCEAEDDLLIVFDIDS